MKRLYQFVTAIVVCAMGLPFFATGQMVADSVEMGATYANDIYYSMENGEVHSVDRNNWDVAFFTSPWSSEILVNDGAGAELRTYPNADTSSWDAIDTTGLHTWPVLYNDPDNWQNGAFSRFSTGHPDYGWGVYNTITHDVVGDSLYILTFADGTAKKVWILKKISTQNTYIFKYANLDGSNEVMETIACGDYTAKNFVYYSMHTGELLDREPASDTWDILFTKYVAILENGSPYPVTGVLNNVDVPANEFNEVGSDFDDWSSMPMDSTKSPIGYDWKYFDMGTFSYVVDDSTAFFVSNKSKDVYKLTFSVFDYMVGKVVFATGLVSPANIGDVKPLDQFHIYPNPASGSVTLEAIQGVVPEAVTITDLSGKIVFRSEQVNSLTRIDIGSIPSGMYLVTIQSGSEQYIQKLLINNN
jgi:hypothetical protein